MQKPLERRAKARARSWGPATGDRMEQDLALRVEGGLQALLPLDLQPMPPIGIDRKHASADLDNRPRPSPLPMSLWDHSLLTAFRRLTEQKGLSPAQLQRCIICAVEVRKLTRYAIDRDTIECLESDVLSAIKLRDIVLSGQHESLLNTFDIPIKLKPERDFGEMRETLFPSKSVWRNLRNLTAEHGRGPEIAFQGGSEDGRAPYAASETAPEDRDASESDSEDDGTLDEDTEIGAAGTPAPENALLDTLASDLADVMIFEEAERVVEEDEASADLSEIGDEDFASLKRSHEASQDAERQARLMNEAAKTKEARSRSPAVRADEADDDAETASNSDEETGELDEDSEEDASQPDEDIGAQDDSSGSADADEDEVDIDAETDSSSDDEESRPIQEASTRTDGPRFATVDAGEPDGDAETESESEMEEDQPDGDHMMQDGDPVSRAAEHREASMHPERDSERDVEASEVDRAGNHAKAESTADGDRGDLRGGSHIMSDRPDVVIEETGGVRTLDGGSDVAAPSTDRMELDSDDLEQDATLQARIGNDATEAAPADHASADGPAETVRTPDDGRLKVNGPDVADRARDGHVHTARSDDAGLGASREGTPVPRAPRHRVQMPRPVKESIGMDGMLALPSSSHFPDPPASDPLPKPPRPDQPLESLFEETKRGIFIRRATLIGGFKVKERSGDLIIGPDEVSTGPGVPVTMEPNASHLFDPATWTLYHIMRDRTIGPVAGMIIWWGDGTIEHRNQPRNGGA
ncbi:hypothetical protein LTR53_013541 [Teratosphaeriaceae sp. CCFEE 6253]|nr:hypothetical protein LTR53_013541 [Teratosphaeriaceae sp. CCFEE 6253]